MAERRGFVESPAARGGDELEAEARTLIGKQGEEGPLGSCQPHGENLAECRTQNDNIYVIYDNIVVVMLTTCPWRPQ